MKQQIQSQTRSKNSFHGILLLAVLLWGSSLLAFSNHLEEVACSEQLWTGVAVSETGRIFVNYPRWSPGLTMSVAEILRDGETVPFPNPDWNGWKSDANPASHLICVQSVYVDDQNFLWILDAANPMLQGVVSGGAKLLKVDLTRNCVAQRYLFDASVALPNSYLNDLRIDSFWNVAYITDSGSGALIVLDLLSGEARRVLEEHPSTKAEDMVLEIDGVRWPGRVHADGIALGPKGKYLYYQALTGQRLYRIATRHLRNSNISEKKIGKKVELVAVSGPADGIAFDPAGNLYLSALEHNAIRRLTPQGEIESVVQDACIQWPDSFSITDDGSVYFTTSQLHLAPECQDPYRIFRIVSHSD